MKNNIPQQLTLPRLRYIVGFGLLALLAIVLAAYKFWDLPSGLTTAEMNAAAVSGQFSWSGMIANFGAHVDWLINFPWVIFQNLSIKLLGFSTFALRLPAVILMILSAAGLTFVAQKWFKKNVAIASGLLVAPSALFMGLARSGDGAAMTVFLITTILFAATIAIESRNELAKFVAKLAVCLALALLVYCPGGVYLAAIFVLVGFLHPKTRLVFLKTKIWWLIIAGAIGLVVATPLLLGLTVGDPDFAKQVLTFRSRWSLDNLAMVGSALTGALSGFAGGFVTPIVSIVCLIVALIGFIRVLTNFFSARAYLLSALLLPALLWIICMPQFVYLLFVPLFLLIMIGVDILIREWYRLFPKNPYARGLALSLIAILVLLNGWFSIAHYTAANSYDADVVYNYNQEFEAARGFLLGQENSDFQLVVADDQRDFYQNLTRDFSDLKVETRAGNDAENLLAEQNRKLIILNSSEQKVDKIPTKIITNSHADNAVLVRVYK